MNRSSAAAGIMLIVFGIWGLSQIWGGAAIERLGI
jgi:hypothetical protein